MIFLIEPQNFKQILSISSYGCDVVNICIPRLI